MGSGRSEEDMRMLLTHMRISPSDDYTIGEHDMSMLASTHSEQDMKLLASIPICPSDDCIMAPPDMSVLTVFAAPESDARDSWDVSRVSEPSLALSASPSLLTSKPMDEIEEEIAHILSPFSRASPSNCHLPFTSHHP